MSLIILTIVQEILLCWLVNTDVSDPYAWDCIEFFPGEVWEFKQIRPSCDVALDERSFEFVSVEKM